MMVLLFHYFNDAASTAVTWGPMRYGKTVSDESKGQAR